MVSRWGKHSNTARNCYKQLRYLDVRDVPESVFWEVDGQDDRTWASFANYAGGKVSKAPWLLVHDADEIEGWIEQGFRVVESPPDAPADEAVQVLAWGELPETAYYLMMVELLDVHRRDGVDKL